MNEIELKTVHVDRQQKKTNWSKKRIFCKWKETRQPSTSEVFLNKFWSSKEKSLSLPEAQKLNESKTITYVLANVWIFYLHLIIPNGQSKLKICCLIKSTREWTIISFTDGFLSNGLFKKYWVTKALPTENLLFKLFTVFFSIILK